MSHVAFGGARDRVHVVQAIKSAGGFRAGPPQADQLHARADHPIGVAIECGVNQHITRGGAQPPHVARFLKAPGQHYGGVGVQVAMARKAERGSQGFDAGRDTAKEALLGGGEHHSIVRESSLTGILVQDPELGVDTRKRVRRRLTAAEFPPAEDYEGKHQHRGNLRPAEAKHASIHKGHGFIMHPLEGIE